MSSDTQDLPNQRSAAPEAGARLMDSPNKTPDTTDKNRETDIEARRAQDVVVPRTLKPISWFFVVSSLLAVLFLFALDNTVVADVQPKIIATLGGIEKLPWISVAFALASISTNLLWGRLYGQFDNKMLFISSVIIFEIGSAICGAAPTINALVVGRAVCGVGGMGTYLGTMNMVSILTNEVERPMYLGFVGLTWGIGTVLGPIIGGAFANSPATWRWAFYINLCIGAVAGPVFIFLLPAHNPRPGITLLKRAQELDFAGAVLVAGAIASLVMAVSFGGGPYTWNSGQIIALFVCAGVLWIAFMLQQAFCILTTPASRLFPVAFLKVWEMDLFFACMAAAQVVVFVPIYFIPLYFQFVRNDSALEAGVRLLPFILLLVFSVMFNGAVMGKLGYYMPWFLLAGILSLIGGALMHTITVDSSPSQIYGYSVIAGFGIGLCSQAGYPIAQFKASPARISDAVAFIGVGQIGGVALALMISNSIFLNEASDAIQKILPDVPRPTVQQAISGARGAFFQTLTPQDRVQVLEAIVRSIDRVYIMIIVAGAVIIVLSLVMKREKLLIGNQKATDADTEKAGGLTIAAEDAN